ncbi:MAG: aminopeptidase P N-terminal domain-containing protein, partial [Bacteroidales bacterium]|nr:aminopeptidase P N-terminal domain-containing protein [Bacteroidales bacterium]
MFDKKIYSARRAQLRKDIDKGLIVFPANGEAAANYLGNTYPFRQDSNF